MTTDKAIGINGLGRIGKLTLWHHVGRGYFARVVVNLGRQVGKNLEAACGVIEKDSTYGSMHRFLYGVNAEPCIKIVDREKRLLEVAGVPVTILQNDRNPAKIPWREHGVRVVVDTTGAFDDPTRPANAEGGALRGHREAGVEKVINSSAFKIKDKSLSLPGDATTLIYGINHDTFDPAVHNLISAASCTTSALAHMVKSLLDRLHASSIMTASMSTVHAATNSQSVLDQLPKADAQDLRKDRSVLNSIILTSTNSSKTLEQVIPEVRYIGFMADSVRVPVDTVSLIILNVTFQTRLGADNVPFVTARTINKLYEDAAAGPQKSLIVFSESQNVAADMAGMKAAVVIEGVETHTRTGFVEVDMAQIPGLDEHLPTPLRDARLRVPVTHAKIFGWYDNEYGSYTNLMADLTVHVHQAIR